MIYLSRVFFFNSEIVSNEIKDKIWQQLRMINYIVSMTNECQSKSLKIYWFKVYNMWNIGICNVYNHELGFIQSEGKEQNTST